MYTYVSEYHSYLLVYHSHIVVCTCLLLLGLILGLWQIARDRWRDQFLICQQSQR